MGQEYTRIHTFSEKVWILVYSWHIMNIVIYDQRKDDTYRLETDWLFCYILIKEPFDFPILVLYSTTSSCFFIPFKASFLKSKVTFFLCFKEFLMESSNKPFQIALFPPSSLYGCTSFLLTNKVHKKEKKLHFPERTELPLIIANLYL